MRTLRCKCGDKIMSTSMGSQDCQGCEKCNTTFSGHPDHHRKLEPHNWVIRYNRKTGKPYNVCNNCLKIEDKSYNESMIK